MKLECQLLDSQGSEFFGWELKNPMPCNISELEAVKVCILVTYFIQNKAPIVTLNFDELQLPSPLSNVYDQRSGRTY